MENTIKPNTFHNPPPPPSTKYYNTFPYPLAQQPERQWKPKKKKKNRLRIKLETVQYQRYCGSSRHGEPAAVLIGLPLELKYT